jgi:O-antigen/teichoic acid export membrane protein
MSTLRIIIKNTKWQLSANILNKLLSIILVIFLARGLGDVEFGKYSFANSFIQIFVVLADLGISLLLIREIAKRGEMAGIYFVNLGALKIILSFGTLSIIAVIINILPYPLETVKIVYILSIYFILSSFSSFCRSIMNAFEKMEYDAIVSFIEKIIIVALCSIFLKLKLGLIYISCAFLVGGAISLTVSSLFLIKKFVKPNFRIDFSFWKSSIREALPFAMSSIFVMMYSYIDQVMLSLMKGDEAVGWYNASFSLVNNVTLFASVFMGAAYPTFSRLYSLSLESLKIVYQKSFKYLLLLGFPITVGAMILSDRIILLFFGNEYFPSISAFRILIWAAFPSHLCYLFSTFLNAINRQKINLYFMIISTVGNIILNLFLIPAFSYLGACIATLLSEIMLFGLGMSYLSLSPYRFFPFVLFMKTILSSVIMACLLLLFFKLNIFVLIISGVAAYGVSLIFLGCIDEEDKEMLRKIIKIGEK